MLLLCQTVTVYASGNLEFDITSSGKGIPGETVSFAVSANKAGITDGKATITYDASKITYEQAKLVYTSEDDALEFVVNSNEKGKLIIVWATIDPMKEPGHVFTMEFTVAADAQVGEEASVALNVAYVNDETGNNIIMSENGGQDSITITIGQESSTVETTVEETEEVTEKETETVDKTIEETTEEETAKEESSSIQQEESSLEKESGSEPEESSHSSNSTEDTGGPETGDTTAILFPSIIMVVSVVLTYCVMRLHRKKGEEV